MFNYSQNNEHIFNNEVLFFHEPTENGIESSESKLLEVQCEVSSQWWYELHEAGLPLCVSQESSLIQSVTTSYN